MLGGNRLDRINQLVRDELAELLRREIEVPPGSLLTITRVEVSPDIEHARVWVSVMPFDHSQEVLQLLQHRIGDLQRALNRKLVMEFVPRIRFLLDTTEDQAARIDELLDKLDDPA